MCSEEVIGGTQAIGHRHRRNRQVVSNTLRGNLNITVVIADWSPQADNVLSLMITLREKAAVWFDCLLVLFQFLSQGVSRLIAVSGVDRLVADNVPQQSSEFVPGTAGPIWNVPLLNCSPFGGLERALDRVEPRLTSRKHQRDLDSIHGRLRCTSVPDIPPFGVHAVQHEQSMVRSGR